MGLQSAMIIFFKCIAVCAICNSLKKNTIIADWAIHEEKKKIESQLPSITKKLCSVLPPQPLGECSFHLYNPSPSIFDCPKLVPL